MHTTIVTLCFAGMLGYLAGAFSSPPAAEDPFTCSQGCVASTEVVVYTRNVQTQSWVEAGTPGDYIEYADDGGPYVKDGTCHCDPQCKADTSAEDKKCRVGAKFRFKGSAGIRSAQEQTGGAQPGTSIPNAYCVTPVTTDTIFGVDIRTCDTDSTSWYLGFTSTNCGSGASLLVKIKYRCTPCNGTCPAEPI